MTNYEVKNERSTGILNRLNGEQFFKLSRYYPTPLLAGLVEHYWLVEWDLPENYTHVQEVLPTLSVQLVFQGYQSTVYGIMKKTVHSKVVGQKWCSGREIQACRFLCVS